MEQQEYFMKMQMLGQEAEQIERQIQIMDQQISEMNAVRESIDEIRKIEKDKVKGQEILANLGKGIFVRADLSSKELFVNIGKDVIVKKTPEETLKIIDEQNLRLNNGKEEFILRIQELQESMQQMLLQMQKEQSTHSHECENEDCECEEKCEDCECEHHSKK